MSHNNRFKFRIWDNLDKRFIYPESLGGRMHYYLNINGTPINMQNGDGGSVYIVQQWTGLNDKHGLDIYEGDILRIEDKSGKCKVDREYEEVIWLNGSFKVKVLEKWPDRSNRHLLQPSENWYEVIGNIFESAEYVASQQDGYEHQDENASKEQSKRWNGIVDTYHE